MLSITTGDNGVIFLNGRFDASQAEKATEEFRGVNGTITLNLSGLEYISSAGLGVLVALYQRLNESGNSVKLRGLSEHLSNIFHYSGLEKLFEIER